MSRETSTAKTRFPPEALTPRCGSTALEHGAVWITYRADLGAEQIARLGRFTGSLDKVIVSPVPGQSVSIVATAWGNRLELADAADSRLEQFVNEFEGSLDAPEPGGRCAGGVGIPGG